MQTNSAPASQPMSNPLAPQTKRGNPNPIVEADFSGDITYFNPAANALFPDIAAKKQKHEIKLVLKPAEGNSNLIPVEKTLKCTFTIQEKSDFPLFVTTDNNSIFTFTLAPIRLGAPIRNELPKNVILKSSGIFGNYYRVWLSDSEEGYINNDYVKELPSGTPAPSYFINPISCYPTESGDVVKIPYLENVPYDVYPEPLQNRIVINLYGVKSSSTWIIHKSNLRYIEEITWQQTSKETYKIYVNLKSSKAPPAFPFTTPV